MSSNNQPETRSPYLEYVHLDNGIHDFIFSGSSAQGVTEWAQQLDKILEVAPAAKTMYQIIDARHGVAPLSHMLREIRRLSYRYPNPPPLRTAIIQSSSMYRALFRALMPLLAIRTLTVEYFSPDERDKAIAWLLSN